MNEVQRIEEAIEIIKQISEEEDFQELIPGRYGTSENYPRYTGKKKEALDLLLNLARSYLSAIKGGVPAREPFLHNESCKGKTIRDCSCGAANQNETYAECYDQMLALLVERDKEIARMSKEINALDHGLHNHQDPHWKLQDPNWKLWEELNREQANEITILKAELSRLRSIGVESRVITCPECEHTWTIAIQALYNQKEEKNGANI